VSLTKISLVFILLLFTGLIPVMAQETVVYANGSLGVNRSYASVAGKYYLKRKAVVSFEIGGGEMGSQNENASSADSPNLSGQNGFQSSISSSIVIAPDLGVPDHMYPSSVTTRFTGEFFRGSYEWRFPPKSQTETERPRGLRFGVELAYFDIIQRQDVVFSSLTTSDTYEFHGTAHCVTIAPGLRLGYDLILFKNLLIAPEIASPFYIPVGYNAKSNGPFAKEAVEVRLGIGWFIR
jgi:hypothetical protein